MSEKERLGFDPVAHPDPLREDEGLWLESFRKLRAKSRAGTAISPTQRPDMRDTPKLAELTKARGEPDGER